MPTKIRSALYYLTVLTSSEAAVGLGPVLSHLTSKTPSAGFCFRRKELLSLV